MFRNLVSRSLLLSQNNYSCSLPSSLILAQCCNNCQSRGIRTSIVDLAQKSQEDDEVLGKGDKVLKLRLRNTRLDALLKAGLNISRSKIEKCFYEDRIRVNGARAKKKSQVADEGDEVDIVRGANKMNPLFIDVNRVEILEIGDSGGEKEDDFESDSEDEEEESKKRIPVILKRYKNLTIENYDIPWKGNVQEG